jgi:hypothetical protein
MTSAGIRSPCGLAAAAILLLGAPIAIAVGIALGDGASAIIHLALGVCFLLLALAVFDFRLPGWMTVLASAGIGLLGAIFLLQGISDVTPSAALRYWSYDVLGQRLEKVLGYVFLLWCVALLFLESHGRTKLFGIVAVVVVLVLEILSFVPAYQNSEAAGLLKLLYLLLFVWLLLESWTPRTVAASR